MKHKDIEQELLLSLIEDVIYSGGENNFAIIGLNREYYIQIAAGKGDYEVYCEAVSNHYLEEEYYLTEDQIQQLATLNWQSPEDSEGNYFLVHPVDSEGSRTNLADLLLTTSKSVYDAQNLTEKDISLNLE
ncbi:MAG: hypothetical protein AAFP82_00375 [Bacteroidota bacterium]